MNTIPKDKLVILDKLVAGIGGEYAAVFENFERDIYYALEQALKNLAKYHTIKIVFPDYTYHPKEILKGFERFCHQYAFAYNFINNIHGECLEEGVAYISLMEDDLVVLIDKILDAKLEIGRQVGVIS